MNKHKNKTEPRAKRIFLTPSKSFVFTGTLQSIGNVTDIVPAVPHS